MLFIIMLILALPPKDLGDNDLLTIFNEENKQDLLKRSLDLLAKIQEITSRGDS